jgi:hypothetical protein
MSKETTAKKRTQVDERFWLLLVEACGGRCVVPDCEDPEAKLERGHIRSNASGGTGAFENIQPVCRPCNGRYNQHKEQMGDWRPAGWRDRFLKLVCQGFGVQIGFTDLSPSDRTLSGENSLEKIRVVDWKQIKFIPGNELLNTLVATPSALPGHEIEELLVEVIRLGRSQTVPIAPPDEKVKSRLRRLAGDFGRETFLGCARYFLKQEEWWESPSGRVRPGWMKPWQTFAENWSMYLDDWRASEQRRVKREAEERERAFRDRWMAYLDACKVTWREMMDADREFAERVKKMASGPPQAVSDTDYLRAQDMLGRYRKFASKKAELKFLVKKQMDLMVPVNPDDQEALNLFYRLRELGRNIEKVEDINDPKLIEYYAEAMQLLPPSRR